MDTLYLPLKHSHLLFVVVSIVLFNLRFWLRSMKPERTLPKILKIVPHVNDTLLLLAGVVMIFVASWQPWAVGTRWLGLKLFLVVAYIGCGFLCMKNPPRSRVSNIAYVISLLLLCMIILLARSKPF